MNAMDDNLSIGLLLLKSRLSLSQGTPAYKVLLQAASTVPHFPLNSKWLRFVCALCCPSPLVQHDRVVGHLLRGWLQNISPGNPDASSLQDSADNYQLCLFSAVIHTLHHNMLAAALQIDLAKALDTHCSAQLLDLFSAVAAVCRQANVAASEDATRGYRVVKDSRALLRQVRKYNSLVNEAHDCEDETSGSHVYYQADSALATFDLILSLLSADGTDVANTVFFTPHVAELVKRLGPSLDQTAKSTSWITLLGAALHAVPWLRASQAPALLEALSNGLWSRTEHKNRIVNTVNDVFAVSASVWLSVKPAAVCSFSPPDGLAVHLQRLLVAHYPVTRENASSEGHASGRFVVACSAVLGLAALREAVRDRDRECLVKAEAEALAVACKELFDSSIAQENVDVVAAVVGSLPPSTVAPTVEGIFERMSVLRHSGLLDGPCASIVSSLQGRSDCSSAVCLQLKRLLRTRYAMSARFLETSAAVVVKHLADSTSTLPEFVRADAVAALRYFGLTACSEETLAATLYCAAATEYALALEPNKCASALALAGSLRHPPLRPAVMIFLDTLRRLQASFQETPLPRFTSFSWDDIALTARLLELLLPRSQGHGQKETPVSSSYVNLHPILEHEADVPCCAALVVLRIALQVVLDVSDVRLNALPISVATPSTDSIGFASNALLWPDYDMVSPFPYRLEQIRGLMRVLLRVSLALPESATSLQSAAVGLLDEVSTRMATASP